MLACSLLGPALWSSGGKDVDPAALVDRCAALVDSQEADSGEAAWVRGRILLASDTIGRPAPPGFSAAGLARELAADPAPPSAFTAWAWSYAMQSLARLPDPSSYEEHRSLWLAAQPPVARTDPDAAWAFVCALAAAAQARDADAYGAFRAPLFSPPAGVCAAIPEGDYRAWACGTVAVAAATAGDAPRHAAARESAGLLLPTAGGGAAVAFACAAFAGYVADTEGDGARSQLFKLSVPDTFAALSALK
jgi:hypothetical protein